MAEVQRGSVGFLAFVDPYDGTLQVSSAALSDGVPDSLSGLVGFSIRADHPIFQVTGSAVLVDLDADGTFVELRSCLTTEGVRLSVVSAEGTALWTVTRSLPYDTEPTCAD